MKVPFSCLSHPISDAGGEQAQLEAALVMVPTQAIVFNHSNKHKTVESE